MFYTYAHVRSDTGEVFYIGKGKGQRAWSKAARNRWWKNIAEAHGYTVQILAQWPSNEEALEHEKFLIACFRDIGRELVNQTDGGEGTTGRKHTPETRAKIAAQRWTHSPETREKMRAAWKTREPASAETRAKIAAALRGRKRAPLPREAIDKMAASLRGRKASDAARTSMRIAQQQRRKRERSMGAGA